MGRQKVHNPFHRQKNLDKFGHQAARRERRKTEGPPQFEVTGTHLLILVAALLALAWLAGLLWVERMEGDPVLQRNWSGVDIASRLARMDLSQRRHVAGLIARLEEERAELEAQIARRVAAEARAAEANRRLAELHVTNHTAGG